ncbi:hypothetical protein DW817_00955 [Acidaminococcus sp. AM33-14BH]|nr:hypothetical protein DW817_00955 [Acidaminococcus sp. AM33-14BH]
MRKSRSPKRLRDFCIFECSIGDIRI